MLELLFPEGASVGDVVRNPWFVGTMALATLYVAGVIQATERVDNPFARHSLRFVLTLGVYGLWHLGLAIIKETTSKYSEKQIEGVALEDNSWKAKSMIKTKNGALNRSYRNEYKTELPPLHLTKNAPMSYWSETEGTISIGRAGAGKTTFLMPIFQEAIARGDVFVGYDWKGELTEMYAEEKGVAFIAPWDRRSWYWDIAQDVTSVLEAETFAYSLMPDTGHGSHDWWSGLARDCAAGVIIHLLRRGELTIKNLSKVLVDPKAVRAACEEDRPGAANIIQFNLDKDGSELGINNKSDSVMAVLREASAFLDSLAAVWDKPGIKAFSVKELLSDSGPKVLIMPWLERASWTARRLTTAIVNMVLEELADKVDALPHERRVVFALDEINQLYKIPKLVTGITGLRSKGARFFIGAQDFGPLRRLYGNEVVETIFNNMGTIVGFPLRSQKVIKDVTSAYGEKRVLRTLKGSQQPSWFGQGNWSTSESNQIADASVVSVVKYKTLKRGEAYVITGELPPCRIKFPKFSYTRKFPKLMPSELFQPIAEAMKVRPEALVSPSESEDTAGGIPLPTGEQQNDQASV